MTPVEEGKSQKPETESDSTESSGSAKSSGGGSSENPPTAYRYGKANRPMSMLNMVMITFLALIGTTQVAEYCTAVISVGSQINIWHEGVLEESFHAYLTVPVGGTICMKENGVITRRILVQDASQIVEYYPAYKTSDYTIESITYSRCLSAGDCPGKCKSGLSPVPETFPPRPQSLVNHTECFPDATNCEGFCFRSEQCVWYYWSLHPTCPQGIVHHLARTHMEVQLKISDDATITVDSLKPKDISMSSLSLKLVTGGLDSHVPPQSGAGM